MFKDEDFEKIVEYTESDEDGGHSDDKEVLNFCEIEEINEENL